MTETFRAVMAETLAVGRARGVDLAPELDQQMWAHVQSFPGTLRASTAIDLEAGRPLETEWINGAVVRLAQDHGIDVPVNRTIYALLTPHLAGRG